MLILIVNHLPMLFLFQNLQLCTRSSFSKNIILAVYYLYFFHLNTATKTTSIVLVLPFFSAPFYSKTPYNSYLYSATPNFLSFSLRPTTVCQTHTIAQQFIWQSRSLCLFRCLFYFLYFPWKQKKTLIHLLSHTYFLSLHYLSFCSPRSLHVGISHGSNSAVFFFSLFSFNLFYSHSALWL